jgi:hypothetical protein
VWEKPAPNQPIDTKTMAKVDQYWSKQGIDLKDNGQFFKREFFRYIGGAVMPKSDINNPGGLPCPD